MRNFIIGFLFIGSLLSCDSDKGTEAVDNFDRKAMLTHWADNIIIPALSAYKDELDKLKTTTTTFTSEPTEANLAQLRTDWLNSYKAWQRVSMFDIGKAEEISIRNFTNIYPTDPIEIEKNILNGGYNLALPSKNDEQGFPALDYLINGLGADDTEIVQKYADSQYTTYLSDIVIRLDELAGLVLDDWKGTYRDQFIANDGSTATSAVNKVVNDYMFYFEKFLRAGKIGIPTGVFSGSKDATLVEAVYMENVSKTLFIESLTAAQDFFNGKHFNSDAEGPGMKSYLDALKTFKGEATLSTLINNQFDSARNAASILKESFVEQLNADTEPMHETYRQLQLAVVLLKVDMFQALNIRVDFVDADGD